MPRLFPILLPCLLALAGPARADEHPDAEPAAAQRPLNLSLPRDVLHAPGNGADAAERNAAHPQEMRATGNTAGGATGLPYGAGYEHRQRQTGGGTRGSMGAGRRGR